MNRSDDLVVSPVAIVFLLNLNRLLAFNHLKYLFVRLFGLASSNLGLQDQNKHLRYLRVYQSPVGIDGLTSLAKDNEHIYVAPQNLHGELDDGIVDGDGNVDGGGGGVYGDDARDGPT